MKGYIEALTEYTGTIMASDDFPQEHVDDNVRFFARQLILALFGNAAEKTVGKYAGLGGFGDAVAKGDWQAAALKADSQNLVLLGSWVKLVYWLGKKSEDFICDGVTTGEGGIRYLDVEE